MSGTRDELVAQLGLLSEIEATQTALFQQAAAARYGLGVSDMKALSIVLREGPQTAGALRAALHLTSGAITGVIDRLESRGVVRREADSGDRRRVMVAADLAGLAAHPNVYAEIGRAFEQLYAGYSLDELSFLARHLRAAAVITEEQTARLHAPDDEEHA